MNNRYRKKVNGREYGVYIYDGWLHATVRVKTGLRDYNKTILTKRKLFCEDIDRFAAQTLSKAVQKREDNIKESDEYDERIRRALDVVEEEYGN